MMRRKNKSGKESIHNGRSYIAVLVAVLVAVAMLVGQPFVSARTYAEEAVPGDVYAEGITNGDEGAGEDVFVTEPDAEQPEEEVAPSDDVTEPDAEQPEEEVGPSDDVTEPDAEQPGEEVKLSDTKREGGQSAPLLAAADDGTFTLKMQWTGLDDDAQNLIDNSSYRYCSFYIFIKGYEDTYGQQPIKWVSSSANCYYYTGSSYYDSEQGRYYYGTYVEFYGNDAQPYFTFSAADGLDIDFNSLEITIIETNAYIESQDEYGYYSSYSFNKAVGISSGYGEKACLLNPGKTEVKVNTTPAESNEIIIDNQLMSMKSIVHKRLLGTDVPAGKTLTWRVERFTDGEWVPAADEFYIINSLSYQIILEGGGSILPLDDAVSGKTGADGAIHITLNNPFWASTASKIPNVYDPEGPDLTYYQASILYVMFQDKVLVNAQSGVEGDLRVVEVEEETAEEWGVINSFLISPWNDFYYNPYPGYINQVYADENTKGFLNSNRKAAFPVKKVVLDDPDDIESVDSEDQTEFTFILEQFEDPDDESSLVIGAGVPYTVYVDNGPDEEDEIISEGTTNENGEFSLQSGQYALFKVKEKTKWKVTEQEVTGYRVAKIDESGAIEDDPGNSAVIDMRPPLSDPVKCQTLKGYAVPQLEHLVRMYGYNYNAGSVRNIYFGKTSDVDPSIITDQYVVMDVMNTGSIRAYADMDYNTGRADVYILSDDLMYLNPESGYMFSGMYDSYYGRGLETVTFSNVDFSLAQNMEGMFQYCTRLYEVNGFSGLNTSSLTNTKDMFKFCTSLRNIDLSNWDTGNLENMSGMFQNCYSLQSANMSNWDTSKVTDMSYLFNNDYYLSSINMENWNTESVETLDYTFAWCWNLQEVDVSNWDTSNVKSMEATFEDIGWQALDLSGWNTANVTNMNYMFCWSSNLVNIYVGDQWKVDNVTESTDMFYSCTSLPNYSYGYYDKTRAYVGEGGYLKNK